LPEVKAVQPLVTISFLHVEYGIRNDTSDRTYAVEGCGEAKPPRIPPFQPAAARHLAQPPPPSRRGRATTGWWRTCGPPPLLAGRRPRTSCHLRWPSFAAFSPPPSPPPLGGGAGFPPPVGEGPGGGRRRVRGAVARAGRPRSQVMVIAALCAMRMTVSR